METSSLIISIKQIGQMARYQGRIEYKGSEVAYVVNSDLSSHGLIKRLNVMDSIDEASSILKLEISRNGTPIELSDEEYDSILSFLLIFLMNCIEMRALRPDVEIGHVFHDIPQEIVKSFNDPKFGFELH